MAIKFSGIILSILIVGLLSGCSLGLSSTASATPTPLPTVAFRPEPTPTEIKAIESQATAVPSLDLPVIGYNEIKEGQLNVPSVADEWVFNGKAGERINIVLNSQFDSYVELFTPDGEFIASNDDNGESLNAALFDVQLKKDGPHTIVIHGFDGAIGDYALALTGGHPTRGGGTLTDGALRTVILSKQGFKWRYQGKAGTYLTVTVSADDLVDAHLSLYGPDGKLLSSDDDSGGNLNPEIFEFSVPADGSYTIQAHTLADTGQVTLNINSSNQPSGGGPLAMGTIQSGRLKRGRSHEWTFAGEVGQVINLSMTSNDFDTFLELRDSQGAVLAENDDWQGSSNSGLDVFTLPFDDTYTIVARGLSENDGGDYEIILKTVKVAAGGGLLEPDTLTQALLLPGQTDSWTFAAEANSFVTVNVQSELLDTYLELYDSAGTLLLADDDSGGDLNAALLDFLIVEAGDDYQLLVRSARADRNEGGVYEILLTTAENLDATGLLIPGQVQTTDLNDGEQHTWTFQAEAGTFATVHMESDVFDTYLSLYDSSGELLTLNDDFADTNAAISNFLIPESGEYRVIARAYSAQEAGEYTISLEISSEDADAP